MSKPLSTAELVHIRELLALGAQPQHTFNIFGLPSGSPLTSEQMDAIHWAIRGGSNAIERLVADIERLTAELEQARRLANGWLDDAMALTQHLEQARAVIRDLMIMRNARGLWICESCGLEAPTAETVQHRPGCTVGAALASGESTT